MTTNNLPVTQEDREAAADYGRNVAWLTIDRLHTREGKHDDWPLVQAFAAHRQCAMNQAAEAERERCAKVAEEYAEVNGEICFDNVLMDPLLHGEPFTSENVARSDDCGVNSAIHSAQSHAGYHIAAAIRTRPTEIEGEGA